MKPKCGSNQPGAFRYHDGEMVQTNNLGDGTVQVEFLCLRCGHRWWHEYSDHNTMIEYSEDDPGVELKKY